MDLVKLTEEIILSIVEDKDIVAVKEFETDNDREILIQVIVKDTDMARVIGKNGHTINSIRDIVQASSYLKDNKIVKINVDSI